MVNKEFNRARYFGLTIYQEAKKKKVDGFGYRARRFLMLWHSNKCAWNWFAIEYGIRWSDKLQWFPIWNSSHNNQRSVTFGIWKLYFQLIYYRKVTFNQKRKLLFYIGLNRFYRLVF